MIIGDPSLFAIESGITRAYKRQSFRALGFFVVHIIGRRYGVHKSDATMLACSFDEIKRRIDHRGGHAAPFAAEPNAGKIADAFRNAIYADNPGQSYFGIPLLGFRKLFHRESNDLLWVPDGDKAFDDGSYILQFDVHERVRIIAFRCGQSNLHDPSTLRDVWLAADDFYDLLQRWHDAFESEWTSMPKVSD